MTLQAIKAVLSGLLITAGLAFILLFFAPLLMGITISETVALKAIEHYSTLVLTVASSFGTVMLCLVILFAVGACIWGLFRIIKWQDTPQVLETPKALTFQERRYLNPPIDKGRHQPVLKSRME